jgi:CBS-domain-containing membrane protein
LGDIAEVEGRAKSDMSWTVSDVMTKDPVAVRPTTSFKSCAKLMRLHELTAIPVVTDEESLVGIVSEADLLAKEAELSAHPRQERTTGKARAMTVSDLMTGELVTTTEDAQLAMAASLMFEHHLKVLPVVDSAQRLIGTVSRAQVLDVFLRSDESIRREVARELRLVPAIVRGNVDAEVAEGVVHLRGEIAKADVTDALTRLVTGIPGVVGVVSHLEPAGKLAIAQVADGGS